MEPQAFCYWLQGFFELDEELSEKEKGLSPEQVIKIKKTLDSCFEHEVQDITKSKPSTPKPKTPSLG